MAIIFSLFELSLATRIAAMPCQGTFGHHNPSLNSFKEPLGIPKQGSWVTSYLIQARKLKPSTLLFFFFWEVHQRLYQKPARIKNHTNDSGYFLGALGFTLPVEELTLWSTSLTTVLDWLTLPHGPSLVDGTSTENKLMALAILVSSEAFADPDSPLVGLGFLYKAPYIQTAPWSEAYFELKLASQAEASSRPLETKLIFVQIQVSSQVIPLPSVPTLFLDVKTPEDITDSKVSQPTRDFRGFHLHQVVLTGEDPPVSQVVIPRLQGQTSFHWATMQDQVLPPELEEAPQVIAVLAAADPNHWNILNDLVYPSCLEHFKARHKASMASRVAMSMASVGSRGENLTPTQELPPTTWPTQPTMPPLTVQDIDVRVTEVMDQVHDLNLQWIQEMGFLRGIDHALSKSLMVEFLRLKVLMAEDLSATLRVWQVEMEAATDNLLRDLDAAAQVSTTLPSQNAAVGTALRQFRTAVQLRVALPLTRLDEACERMEEFIWSRLREMLSQQETKDLSSRIADHRGKIRQLLHSESLRHPEVAPLVLVGLAANFESNFFPGVLEGLLESLGIAATGGSNPPSSSREGARRAWSTAVGEAISRIEQKEVKAPVTVELPPSLDPVYQEDPRERQRDLIPPPFTDPLFIPSVARAVFEAVRPPVVPKAFLLAGPCEAALTLLGPKDRGSGPEASKPTEPTPSTSQPCLQVPEPGSTASDTDSGKAEEITSEEAPPPRSLKVRFPLGLLKRSHETAASGSKSGATPSKVRKGPEAEESETAWSTGPSKADLSKACFELYQKDRLEVRDIQAQILELDDRDDVTQEVLDSSPTFRLRRAADESHSPTIIGDLWIDHLESEGCIAQCKPNDFQFEEEWLPLYTRAGITKHVSGVSALIKAHMDSPLIAVIPSNMAFQSENEYVIRQLHGADCLSRITIYYGDGQRKQLAFCPYCGVMYENSATAYSHARKHLGMTFLCRGCYNKIYRAPQHLIQHRRNCSPCLMSKPESSRRSGRNK